MKTCVHRCGRPPTPGYQSCEPCRERKRAYNKMFVVQLVEDGRCIRCTRMLSIDERRDEYTRCTRCRADERERGRQSRPPPSRVVCCARCGEPGHYAKTCTQAPRRVA
jgi:hypothetical protein